LVHFCRDIAADYNVSVEQGKVQSVPY